MTFRAMLRLENGSDQGYQSEDALGQIGNHSSIYYFGVNFSITNRVEEFQRETDVPIYIYVYREATVFGVLEFGTGICRDQRDSRARGGVEISGSKVCTEASALRVQQTSRN
ncbi:hypothetical protein CIHG_04752 [Coccidioides immitis H538.4]|uniref:Uncharacterized protein n=1 Tax=Coccidioides immitis H538.4 TaxID=396776 RepID=A0A0J8RRS9_COCIT|nr:hypothetical protein CIHG_04752 [Coccidioides immitis H538.4]